MDQPSRSIDVRRQLPWTDGVAEPLPADGPFTQQERWAWTRIARGMDADLRYFPADDAALQAMGRNAASPDGGGGDPKQATEWPAHRDISALFMRTILFHEPWKSARVRPFVRITCARFQEELDWEDEYFAGELNLYDCLFKGGLLWRSLHVGRSLSLSGSVLEGRLTADQLHVEGTLTCSRILAKNEIRILDARIFGVVNFIGAQLEDALNANRLGIQGSLFLSDGFIAKKQVILHGAKVGGVVTFIGGTFEGLVSCDGIAIERDFFVRDVKKLGNVNMPGARVGSSVMFWRSAIEGVLDLTHAEIVGELSFNFERGGGPIWGEKAGVILRNAKAGAFAGGLGSLKRGRDFVPFDLGGFSYDRIGGLGAGGVGSTLASSSGSELRRWLKRCRAQDHYDPAPYRSLASALQEAGRKDLAADVRVAQGDYELVATGTPVQQRLMLFLSRVFIGYGERNHRALLAFAVLVVAAATVGYWQDLRWYPSPTPLGWEDRQAWFDWLGFAFGDAVPVLTFDEAHKTFLIDRFCGPISDVGECTYHPPTGLTAFFYGVKVVGFVILSYLAAGLSGLAQRKD